MKRFKQNQTPSLYLKERRPEKGRGVLKRSKHTLLQTAESYAIGNDKLLPYFEAAPQRR
jgi:hypothetical protein